jgi:chromosome partitioning protein
MRNVITVMNAKGGVGKTTLVLALAETLSAYHRKRVLVIDSDAHASLSSMLLRRHWLETIQNDGRTFVDYLIGAILTSEAVRWQDFVAEGVSDVDDARSVSLMLGGGHLTLFEREVAKGNGLRQTVRGFLAEARLAYDVVLIDSAPGLSVLTECWLREADFRLSPAKPDYLSTRGLQFLQQFSARDADMGFAEDLGLIVSMKDSHAPEDEQFDRWLRQNFKGRCFRQPVLRSNALQNAGYFSVRPRSYSAKYPGKVGRALRDIAEELLERLAEAQSREKTSTPAEAGVREPVRARV